MIDRKFLTAGHAIFTVSNPAGQHFTYKVAPPRQQRNPQQPVYFVNVLTGPDNQSDYSPLGLINHRGEVFHTKTSKIGEDALSFKVAKWALELIWKYSDLPAGYKIQHEGRCGKCGRPLTDPVSIETGLGPICAGRE